jgi:hypothetical protein
MTAILAHLNRDKLGPKLVTSVCFQEDSGMSDIGRQRHYNMVPKAIMGAAAFSASTAKPAACL